MKGGRSIGFPPRINVDTKIKSDAKKLGIFNKKPAMSRDDWECIKFSLFCQAKEDFICVFYFSFAPAFDALSQDASWFCGDFSSFLFLPPCFSLT